MARLKESEVIELVSIIHDVTEEERADILKKLLKNYGALLRKERERFTYLVEEEELEAEERLILVHATKFYSQERGASFTTFLKNELEYGLLNFLNNYGPIHYSDKDRRTITEVHRAKRELENENPDTFVSEYDIQRFLKYKYPPNVIRLVLENREQVLPFDTPINEDALALSEQYGEDDSYFDDQYDSFVSLIEPADLTMEEEKVVLSTFLSDDSFSKINKELSKELGVSASRISQIRKSAYDKIREANKNTHGNR